VKPSDVTASQV